MKSIVIVLCVTAIVRQAAAQSMGRLEGKVVDPSEVYERGERVFVDVVIHVEAEWLKYVSFCVEKIGGLDGGTILLSEDIGDTWRECQDGIPRSDNIVENRLGVGAGLCASDRIVRVTGGRVKLGQVVLRVEEDHETVTTGEIRIGRCNALPQHAAFCLVGMDGAEVMLEDSEPVTVRILRPAFIRGDGNYDEQVDIADAIYVVQELFGGQDRGWPCRNAADANDDDKVDISDAIYLINFLFLGTLAPPPPFPEKGYDPDPTRPEWSGCGAVLVQRN